MANGLPLKKIDKFFEPLENPDNVEIGKNRNTLVSTLTGWAKPVEGTKQGGKSVAKIRHVVYRAADPEAMAHFFVNAFGMTIVHRRPSGAIDLSDGSINLALLPVRSQGQQGIDHIGFMVDDEEEAFRRLEAAGARKIGSTIDPYQVKFDGPEGIMIEVGKWRGAEPIG